MWPLLFCSFISLTITVERIIFWWRERKKRDPSLVSDIFQLTEAGKFQAAMDLNQLKQDGTARMLLSGLKSRGHGLSEGMEVAAADVIERTKRGLNILDTIITMSPLLGILGTVIGIIESFDLLGLRGITDPRGVIAGIAQALITTAAGLSIALLTLVPYNALVHRVQKTARYLGQIGTQFEMAYKKGLEREGLKRI